MLHNPTRHQKQGEENNPISLDDDGAEGKLKSLLEEARNKAIIQEAEFTNDPVQLCFAVAKTFIQGDLSVKKRELNKIIQRYFQETLSIKISHEHFYPRPQPDYSDPGTQPKLTEILLYGVDFLTTNAIKDRLNAIEAEIQEITWINDSTCKVVCHSKEEADRILKTQVGQIKLEDQEERVKGWFLLKPYTIYTFERPLWARYATTAEQFSKQITSKYLLFVQAKAGLPPFILNHFNAEDKYRAVVEEIHAKRYVRRRPRRQNRESFYSRSREKRPTGVHRQRQYIQNEHMRQQRANRFKRNANQASRIQQYEQRQARYAHQPVENYDYSYDKSPLPNVQDMNQSYEYSLQPIESKSNHYNADFNFNPLKASNRQPQLDFSMCAKKKEVRAVFDNISELQSDLSFNDFGTFRIRKESNNDENDRTDYRFNPIAKGFQKEVSRQNFDCSFLLNQKSGGKQDESGCSFYMGNPALQDEESVSSDFFDFHIDKARPKQSTMNSSFRYQPRENIGKKTEINTNFLDDDSY